jgi:hypothetical protein
MLPFCSPNQQQNRRATTSPELTPDQIQALLRLRQELDGFLGSVGISDVAAPTPAPQWRGDYARIWRLLHAVRQAGGDLSADEWARLGAAHDYDPRGLGGFFRGGEPVMTMQGERRVLTEQGQRFIERWERDFGRLTDEHGTYTLVRQRRADGGEFENVVDADPAEVQAEYDRISGHGLMLIRDRRTDDPGRASGIVWQVWTSSLVSFEPTDRLPDPLPARLSAPPASSSDQEPPPVRQLARIMELVGQVADVARLEIEQPPEHIGVGQPGTWTRTTGLLSRVDAQAAVYDRLGGPPLPDALRTFTRTARQLPTNQKRMVGEAEGILAMLTHFMESADFGTSKKDQA